MRPHYLARLHMTHCEHLNSLRYTRRIFSNGTAHYCVQCSRCFATVKTQRHNGNLFIKHEEIPPGVIISDWIDPNSLQGGLI